MHKSYLQFQLFSDDGTDTVISQFITSLPDCKLAKREKEVKKSALKWARARNKPASRLVVDVVDEWDHLPQQYVMWYPNSKEARGNWAGSIGEQS